jgi:uncharacterized protein (DUF58 family)
VTSGALGRIAPGRAEVLLRRVELSLSRRLAGQLTGTHPGLGIGTGLEPESSRAYQPGVDDVRFMDWPVTARLGVPHVRDHVPERELNTTVVVDATASMAFGTVQWPKRELAVAVVAGVSVLTARPANRLSALVFGATPQPWRWPPQQGRRAQQLLLDRLLRLTPLPGARDATLAAGLRRAGGQARRRGLVVVVSDFLDDDVPAWALQVRRLAARHDVVAVEVVDPRERALPDVGALALTDPETGRTAVVDTGHAALRDAYRAVAAEHAERVRQALRAAGAQHLVAGTDADWLADLARFVLAARARAGARARAAVPA